MVATQQTEACLIVLLDRGMNKRLKDVHVLKGEAAVMSSHFLIKGKLKVAEEWRNKVGE